MKKQLLLIVLIILILSASCGKNHQGIETPTENNATETTTEASNDELIKNHTTGEIFNVNTEIKGAKSTSLTDKNSVEVMIGESNYYFPFVVSRFEQEEWEYLNHQGAVIDNIYEETNVDKSVDIVFRKNETSFVVKQFGMLEEPSGYAGESIITDIILLAGKDQNVSSWVLPGGITAKSTAADVLSVFGDPNNTKTFSAESGNTENSLIYISEEKTGLSYSFNFNQDGTIVDVELSISDNELNRTILYSNEYFSIQLPGFWQGRYIVKKEGDDTYQFRFKEGGHLFSIMISESEVYDYSTNSVVIGTLTGKNHHYELAYRFPSDDQAPQGYESEYYAMNTPLSPSKIFDSIKSGSGYTYQKVNYSSFLGSYSTGSLDSGGYGLEIEETDGSAITFTLGFYSNSKISELEHIEVTMSQGKGRFYYEEDGWGVFCEGYIRLENGKAFIYVNTVDQSGSLSFIQTKGEKELKKTESDNSESSSTNKAYPSELIIDQNVRQYLDWTYGDLIKAFGDDYTFDKYNHLQYKGVDIAFQGEHNFETGTDECIDSIIIYGDHDLGNGISSSMTVSEIANVFGGTEYPSERSDGGYDLVVYQKNYCYGFIWSADCNQPSDLVYIFDANH